MADGKEYIDIEVRTGDSLDTLKETGKGFADLGAKAEASGKKVDSATAAITKSIQAQEKALEELKRKMEAAQKAAGKAFAAGNDSEYRKQSEEVKRLASELNAGTKELAAMRQALQEEANVTETDARAKESLRSKLRGATQELAELLVQYRSLSAEEQKGANGQAMLKRIESLTDEAGNLKDAMDDANTAIKNTASDTQTFDAISQGLNLAASAAGAYVGVLGMLGASEEEQQAIQTKLQASLAISNALTTAQTALQKQSALMLGVTAIQAKAAAVATEIKTAAEGKSVVVTKAATIAQAAFNAVAKANPYVVLAAALVTVVGAITAFAMGTKKAKDAEEAAAKAAEEHAEIEKNKAEYYKALVAGSGALITKYNALAQSYQKLQTTAQKTEWIKANKSAMDELGISVRSLNEADSAFIANSQQMVRTFQLRAQVAALQKLAAEEVEKAEAQRTADGYNGTNNQGNGNGKYNLYDLSAKGYSDRYIKAQEELQKLEKELGVFKKYQGETATDSKDKIAGLEQQIGKMAYTARMGAEDARIQAQKDGEEKMLAQLDLDHKKEMDKLAEQRTEYINKQKELAKLQGKSYDQSKDEQLPKFAEQAMYLEQVYAKTRDEIKASTQQAINEFLAQSGSYTDQIEAIMTLYQDKMQKASTDGERLTLATEMQQQLAAVKESYRNDLQGITDEGLQSMLTMLNELVTANAAAFDTDKLNAYKEQIASISNELAERKPVLSLKEAQAELDTASTERQGAESEYKAANMEVLQAQIALQEAQNKKNATGAEKIKAVQKAEQNLTAAKIKASNAAANLLQKQQKEVAAEEKVKAAKQQTRKAIKDLGNSLSDIGSTMDNTAGKILGIVGSITTTVIDSIEAMEATSVAGATAIQMVEKASVILAIISAALQVAMAIANLFNSDSTHDDNISKIQDQVDALKESYKDLEEAVDRTYAKEKAANIEAQIANKQQQIQLIYQQIDEERAKKDADESAIKDYQQQILDLQRDIKGLKESAVDAIFGEDINSAIENFAEKYAEAWSNGTTRVKSARDAVKQMMQQMVSESIKSALESSNAIENIRKKLADFYQDGVLSAWEQSYIKNMAEEASRALDEQFGWAEDILNGNSETSGTAGGFATASQESVDELNGRFTAVQMSTASIDAALREVNEQSKVQMQHLTAMREYTEQAVNLSMEAVDYLGRIEKHTSQLYEINSRLEKIELNTQNI